jgi:hypothetical protein
MNLPCCALLRLTAFFLLKDNYETECAYEEFEDAVREPVATAVTGL